MAAGVASKLDLEVILFRAYHIPYTPYVNNESYYAGVNFSELIASARHEANRYLEEKTAEVKTLGVNKVKYVSKEGVANDEIIALGRETPDDFDCHVFARAHGNGTVV